MQGFNMGRYIPPDLEGRSSGNQIHQRRAAGTLRKDGTQTVRFEMPFAVWCQTCKPAAIIGQGVRFNAVKTKCGYYYGTPIWSFRLKHVACGGTIEVRTDPKNTAYVVVAGGKARDYGDDNDRVREGEGGIPILTAEERERRREDAFAQLEDRAEEKAQVKDNVKRIEELYRAKERDWDDPWSANRRIRANFRHERKIRRREEEATEALKERLGTDIELLPETEEDVRKARLIEFGESTSEPDPNVLAARTKAMFENSTAKSPRGKNTKPTKLSAKELLRKQLIDNTRATINPFGAPNKPNS
nr:protein saf4 [Quercus suber]